MALALLMPPKAKAAPASADLDQDDQGKSEKTIPAAAPDLTGRWDFGRLFNVEANPTVVASAVDSAQKIKDLATTAVELTAEVSQAASDEGEAFTPKPMNYEEIRLWLQCYNAGPYATLKYKGEVPYKETRNYVPRVLKYYEEDLSSEYDEYIEKAAKKYGLEPQLIRAVMKTESNFRNDTVSHAGARGLLQVMPVVWKDVEKKYKFNWNYHTDVFDPEKNIEVACAYLAWLRYDFLPRHFAAFERHPDAPSVLVRDVDRGVPDRKSPRIIAKSDTTTPRSGDIELASADEAAIASAVTSDVGGGKTVADASKGTGTAKAAELKEVKGGATDSDKAGAESKAKSSKEVAAKSKSKEAKAESGQKSESTAKSDSKPKAEVAARGSAGSEKTADAGSSKARSRVVVTDSRSESGKAGKGTASRKAISITVSKGGKVSTRDKVVPPSKETELARGSSRSNSRDDHGG